MGNLILTTHKELQNYDAVFIAYRHIKHVNPRYFFWGGGDETEIK
jgi:hypothetical protein